MKHFDMVSTAILGAVLTILIPIVVQRIKFSIERFIEDHEDKF